MRITSFKKATELMIKIDSIERSLAAITGVETIRFYGEQGYIHQTSYEPLIEKYVEREIRKLKTKLNKLKKEFKAL